MTMRVKHSPGARCGLHSELVALWALSGEYLTSWRLFPPLYNLTISENTS